MDYLVKEHQTAKTTVATPFTAYILLFLEACFSFLTAS